MRFCDNQKNHGRGRGYQQKPKAEADNPYRGHKPEVTVFHYMDQP